MLQIPAAFLGLILGSTPSFAQKVDLSVGWAFTHADQTNGFADLNGWYGSASYNVMPRLGLTVEHESYWGNFNSDRMNNHVWLGGVTWKLANSERKKMRMGSSNVMPRPRMTARKNPV